MKRIYTKGKSTKTSIKDKEKSKDVGKKLQSILHHNRYKDSQNHIKKSSEPYLLAL